MGDTQISRDFTLSLVLVIIVFIIAGGCVKNYYTARECPVGYDLLSAYPTPEFETFCGSFEAQKNSNYRCCQRTSDVNEICRYNLNDREIASCYDLRGNFGDLFDDFRSCKDDTPCGNVNGNLKCAGVSCGNDEICVVQPEKGVKTGKCVDNFILNNQQIYVMNNGITCGLKSGPEVYGNSCTDEQIKANLQLGLGNHCVVSVNLLDKSKTRFMCTGNI